MKTIPFRMTFSLKILDPDMIADPDEVRPENSDDRMDGEMLFFFEKSYFLESQETWSHPWVQPWTRPMIQQNSC